MVRGLDTIASVRSGYQFRGAVKPELEGDVSVIQAREVTADSPVPVTGLVQVKLGAAAEPYLIRQGDVLFLSRGLRLAAAVVAESPYQVVAPGYFFIIRPDLKQVVPGYLAWYLNQVPAQNQIRLMQTGTHMPIVPLSRFRSLEIQLPPLETQQAMAKLAELSYREAKLLDELKAAKRQLVDAISLDAMKSSGTGKRDE